MQSVRLTGAGQLSVMGCVGSTSKERVQEAACPQESCAVKVTVVVPPQKSGGLRLAKSVIATRHPPVTSKESIHSWNRVASAVESGQGGMLRLLGQITLRVADAGTVKATVQEAVCPQESCALKVMVVVPPQESGGVAADRSVESTKHPPTTEKESIQDWNRTSMAAWVRQESTVRGLGHATLSVGAVWMVKVGLQDRVLLLHRSVTV